MTRKRTIITPALAQALRTFREARAALDKERPVEAESEGAKGPDRQVARPKGGGTGAREEKK